MTRQTVSRSVMVDPVWRGHRQIAVLIGWVAILAAISGCGAPEEAPKKIVETPVVRAEVAQVQLSRWPATVRTQGSLVADEVAIVGAKVAGRVEQLNADLGDFVEANTPLASLQKEEFALGVTLAKAQLMQSRSALGLKEGDPVEKLVPENAPPVREAQAIWDEAKTKTARLQQLRASNTITAEEYDQAVAAEQVAAARHASALNGVLEKIAYIQVRSVELSLAEQRLADAVIVAPFEGRVQQRHIAPGTFVQVGDPILTLVRSSTLRFQGTMPERHAHRLALGQDVTLKVDSLSEPVHAKVTRISPVIQQQVRSVLFEAVVDNRDGRLGAGQFAEAEVVVDPNARAILIPRSALVEFAGAVKVWKVVDSMAQEQPVHTARREEDWVEVVEGLAAGDTILVDAAQGQIARIDPIATDRSPGDAVTTPVRLSHNAANSAPTPTDVSPPTPMPLSQ